MKLNFWFVCATIVFTLTQVNAIGYKCKKHVKVRKGDTCSSVWTPHFRTNYLKPYINDIARFNAGVDCSNLKVGTKICIVKDNKNKDHKKSIAKYVTKKGDTCKSVAKKIKQKLYILESFNQDRVYEGELCYAIERSPKGGVTVEYRKDGIYTPDFSHSEDVTGKKYYVVNTID